jgi:protein Tex
LAELEKPGRDPRPEFKTATFQEGVESLSDLRPDMILEGVVTNVAAFGAFVDIGVHQDGLVHVSALANKFVKDPHEVVKPGQIVKVKVLEVDVKRQRIALSMRLDDQAGARTSQRDSNSGSASKPGAAPNPGSGSRRGQDGRANGMRDQPRAPEGPSAMALAFAKLKK